jgi:hypothetical protein
LGHEGEQRHPGPDVIQLEDTALRRRAGRTHRSDPSHAEQGRHGIDAGLVVVVASHHHHRRHLRQLEQGPPDDLLGAGGRGAGVEDIARHHRQVDLAGGRHRHHLGEDGAVLLGPVAAPHPTPHMPIGGVEDLHGPDGMTGV